MAAILSAILYPLYPPLGFFGKNPPFYLPLYPPPEFETRGDVWYKHKLAHYFPDTKHLHDA